METSRAEFNSLRESLPHPVDNRAKGLLPCQLLQARVPVEVWGILPFLYEFYVLRGQRQPIPEKIPHSAVLRFLEPVDLCDELDELELAAALPCVEGELDWLTLLKEHFHLLGGGTWGALPLALFYHMQLRVGSGRDHGSELKLIGRGGEWLEGKQF